MTYYINVYEIPNDGRRWHGHAVESLALSKEMAAHGNAIYRLRVRLK
jgi:hypothetical protein